MNLISSSIITLASCLIYSSTIFPQQTIQESRDTLKQSVGNNYSDQIPIEQPWANSSFLAFGYGSPQGIRTEIGYNVGNNISLGITAGYQNMWSDKPADLAIGLIGGFRFKPISNTPMAPYILIGYGVRPTLTEFVDSYFLLFTGLIMPINSFLMCRSEIGLAFTNKRVSGGVGIFGTTPAVNDSKTLLGLNITLEVEVIKMF